MTLWYPFTCCSFEQCIYFHLFWRIARRSERNEFWNFDCRLGYLQIFKTLANVMNAIPLAARARHGLDWQTVNYISAAGRLISNSCRKLKLFYAGQLEKSHVDFFSSECNVTFSIIVFCLPVAWFDCSFFFFLYLRDLLFRLSVTTRAI